MNIGMRSIAKAYYTYRKWRLMHKIFYLQQISKIFVLFVSIVLLARYTYIYIYIYIYIYQ